MGLSAFNRARERQAQERAKAEQEKQEKQEQMKQKNAGETENINSETPGVFNAEEKPKKTRRKV